MSRCQKEIICHITIVSRIFSIENRGNVFRPVRSRWKECRLTQLVHAHHRIFRARNVLTLQCVWNTRTKFISNIATFIIASFLRFIFMYCIYKNLSILKKMVTLFLCRLHVTSISLRWFLSISLRILYCA